MKQKRMKQIALMLSLVPLLAGCGSVKISPGIVKQSVATGVAYSVLKYPQAIPGVKVGREIICAASTGTNISPAVIVAAINSSGSPLSDDAVLILNAALVLYIGIWESYGEDALNRQPQIRPYLVATCEGLTQGLPVAERGLAPTASAWPQVRFK